MSEENLNTQSIKNALQELKNVTPSKEILLATKIGHKVNALRQHEDETVKKLARQILKDWKKFYRDQRQRPVIEVRSDARSEMLRMKARKLIADSMEKNVSEFFCKKIARLIEHEYIRLTTPSIL